MSIPTGDTLYSLPRDIFSLKILCDYVIAFQVFHGDMIIVKRVFPSLFYHFKMESKFSVEKNNACPYNDPLYQNCCKYGRIISLIC